MQIIYTLNLYIFKILRFIIRLFSSCFFYKKKHVEEFLTKNLHLEKIKNEVVKKYLKRYNFKFNLSQKIIETNHNNSKKIVWQLWLQGWDYAPDIVQYCMKSIDKYCVDYQIIRLTKNNLHHYISLPNYIIEKNEEGVIPNAHFCDLVRLFLLENYGGIWIDATVLLTAPLPRNIVNNDFFAFTLPMDHNMRKFHLTSNWFIISKSNNILTQGIKKSLLKYWKIEKKLLDYFIFHIIFLNNIEDNDVLAKEWSKCEIFYNDSPHKLQFLLKNSFNEKYVQEILKESTIHKLTYDLAYFKKFVQWMEK